MPARLRSTTLVVAACVAAAASAPAQGQTVVANSVNDFSGTQGSRNWFYGYWNRSQDANGTYAASEFTQFATYSPGFWSGNAAGAPASGLFTNLSAGDGHPNGANSSGGEVWAIRRFAVQSTAQYAVTGEFGKTDTGGGTGTIASILVNGVQVFTRTVGGTTPPSAYSHDFGLLSAGTLVDFVLAPNGNDFNDTSRFTAELTTPTPLATVPEPSTYALLGAGLLALGGAAGRRRARA